jgi:hypothetical protein
MRSSHKHNISGLYYVVTLYYGLRTNTKYFTTQLIICAGENNYCFDVGFVILAIN